MEDPFFARSVEELVIAGEFVTLQTPGPVDLRNHTRHKIDRFGRV
jgi:hypothetical protein